MNRFIFFFIFLGLIACKHSIYNNQSKDIIIKNADFDFGVVPDSVELLHHRFPIVNNTSDTCYITRVEKSCGCTNVKLSNPVIVPFSSVFLDVEINLGSNYSFFERDISIYTNFKKEPYPIFVRASRKMPVQVIRQEFPLKISEKLRINTPFLIMGNINFGGSKLGYINILNTSDKSVSFSAEITEAPSFVSIFHEKKIAPNQVGRIIIIIDLSEIKDIWGLQKYHLLIKSEGKRLIIPIEAIFVEKFIKKVDKPRLLVPVSSYTIDTSINSEVKFLYRNIGKDTLHIRNTKRNGPADFISVGSYQIPPESQDYY